MEQSDIDALRIAAERADMKAVTRIVQKYAELSRRLQPYINALTNAIKANPEARVTSLSEYKSLIAEVEQEIADFSAYLVTEVKAEAERASKYGVSDAVLLLALAAGLSRNEMAKLLKPPDTVSDVLNDYLDKNGPLMQRIRGSAGFAAGLVADIIKDGMAIGRNPLTIASEIVKRGLGVSLTNAMRWTRTVQLYSYRWGTAALYQANSDIVKGWIWWAELDDKVCMSCAALHGKVFSLEEGIANDHYNGRCAMLPYIPGATDQYANPNAGKEWFDGLSAEQQRDLMGAGKYEAYQAGKFEFDALTTTHEDEIYGIMRAETPLKGLINES